MSDILSAQKRENSPVPLPSSHRPPKAQIETLEQRVARGDHTALAATVQACVVSLEAWCQTIEKLPNAHIGTAEGSSLAAFKAQVLPKLKALAAEGRSVLPK